MLHTIVSNFNVYCIRHTYNLYAITKDYYTAKFFVFLTFSYQAHYYSGRNKHAGQGFW